MEHVRHRRGQDSDTPLIEQICCTLLCSETQLQSFQYHKLLYFAAKPKGESKQSFGKVGRDDGCVNGARDGLNDGNCDCLDVGVGDITDDGSDDGAGVGQET